MPLELRYRFAACKLSFIRRSRLEPIRCFPPCSPVYPVVEAFDFLAQHYGSRELKAVTPNHFRPPTLEHEPKACLRGGEFRRHRSLYGMEVVRELQSEVLPGLEEHARADIASEVSVG